RYMNRLFYPHTTLCRSEPRARAEVDPTDVVGQFVVETGARVEFGILVEGVGLTDQTADPPAWGIGAEAQAVRDAGAALDPIEPGDRKSTRLNSSHVKIS